MTTASLFSCLGPGGGKVSCPVRIAEIVGKMGDNGARVSTEVDT